MSGNVRRSPVSREGTLWQLRRGLRALPRDLRRWCVSRGRNVFLLCRGLRCVSGAVRRRLLRESRIVRELCGGLRSLRPLRRQNLCRGGNLRQLPRGLRGVCGDVLQRRRLSACAWGNMHILPRGLRAVSGNMRRRTLCRRRNLRVVPERLRQLPRNGRPPASPSAVARSSAASSSTGARHVVGMAPPRVVEDRGVVLRCPRSIQELRDPALVVCGGDALAVPRGELCATAAADHALWKINAVQ